MGTQTRRRAAKILGWFAVWAAAACAGAQFDGSVFRSDELAFRVGPVPASWRRIQVDQALLAYRDDADSSTIAVNGRCGKDGDDVPLEALTQHLFLLFTDRQIVSQQHLPMDGREALRTELIAELDGVPKHYTVYVLKKDGCVYDFFHIGPVQPSVQSQQSFDQFVRGFSTQMSS
ncbi:MAG TPA: hypothetical protein VGJ84_24220 [Polyangiaceae bacterium]|jgi:hypothetical protein